MKPRVDIGLNGRFFPANWRPALDEIEFAASRGFRCIQFPGRDSGLNDIDLGAPLPAVARALRNGGLTAVMEIVVRVDADGRTADGRTPVDILVANRAAIVTLPCRCVHWHLVPLQPMTPDENDALECLMIRQFEIGAALGQEHGFTFGFEHNEPELLLFGTPDVCARTLDAVPGLHFVWDVNHTIPEHDEAFAALLPRTSMLHVSDTPLPEVNHHLPVGMGAIDFDMYARTLQDAEFSGPAVLEIGGLPKSGGYGRDTDEALVQSLYRLAAAFL